MAVPDPISEEIRQLPPIRSDRPTARKYDQIKRHLSQIASRYPAGTRLPPIRTLSQLFDVALTPVQRAVAELCQENILDSRPGSGVYIGDTTRDTSGDALVPLAPVVRQLRIQCARVYPFQTAFWDAVAASYEQDHPQIKICWRDNEEDLPPDIVETVPHHWLRESHDVIPWLDLRDFLLPTTTNASIQTELERCPYFVPCHQTMPCMLVNLDWLKTMRLPAPSYHDFTSQMAYIEQLTDYESPQRRVVGSNIQPAIWLGSYNEQLMHMIACPDDTEATIEISQLDRLALQLLPVFRAIMQFPTGDPLVRFVRRQTPILLTWSYLVGALRHQKPSFQWAAYPLIAADNRISALQVDVGVNRDTTAPMDCIRFIEHLRSDAVQKSLVEHDLVRISPGPEEARRLFSSGTKTTEWIPGALKKLHHLAISSHQEAYLYTNIINQELRACASGNQSLSQTISRIIALGQAYLKHFGPEKAAYRND